MNQSNSISFKECARRHQVKFREEGLKVGYNVYETCLREEDALQGLVFYDGFNIRDAAFQRYNPHKVQNRACYANMLRSEHIPFNFFVPLSKNLEYARAVMNRFMGSVINMINEIRIEYVPDPEEALKDKTSFDVFIEYRHASGGLRILGIEVKYTEREYKLIKDSKEDREIHQDTSVYNQLTDKIGLYRKEILQELKTDEFRQVWRNQLLGESLTRKNHPDARYEYFTSIILYPAGNDHFRELIPEYQSFLTKGHESSFKGITYEEFLYYVYCVARGLTVDVDFLRWLQYLKDRYIVKS